MKKHILFAAKFIFFFLVSAFLMCFSEEEYCFIYQSYGDYYKIGNKTVRERYYLSATEKFVCLRTADVNFCGESCVIYENSVICQKFEGVKGFVSLYLKENADFIIINGRIISFFPVKRYIENKCKNI